ncbi:MAG TPA: hypothetical protein VE153_33985 [Myxococcus sp.]|nr:hypothetical protein [Myxococcus sp.]
MFSWEAALAGQLERARFLCIVIWSVTEGVPGPTSPSLGGRVVFFVDQSAID